MNILLFGATGMVGQGVLRECLLDPEVESVLSVGRSPTGRHHPKLREILHADMLDLTALEPALVGCDACLFCLGVSSVGLSEADYARVTHDVTLAVAGTLARLAPGMTFVYLSASGSDRTERGRVMWARVRGRTENDLFRLPFARIHSVRPAGIRPMHGIRSRTRFVDLFYRMTSPVLPLIQAAFPAVMTSTEEFGRAMLALAKGYGNVPVVESRDIGRLASSARRSGQS